MPGKLPPILPNEDLRRPTRNVVDQRQQQIDPAGRHRRDVNWRPETNRKQPGGKPASKGGRGAVRGEGQGNTEAHLDEDEPRNDAPGGARSGP